jgi:hypothetical protein
MCDLSPGDADEPDSGSVGEAISAGRRMAWVGAEMLRKVKTAVSRLRKAF